MAQDNYNYSGSFEIEECELRTHHGNKVDLSSGQVIIGVYEDIMQGFLKTNFSPLFSLELFKIFNFFYFFGWYYKNFLLFRT